MVQLLDLGEPEAGRIGVKLALVAPTARAAQAEARVLLCDAAGAVLAERTVALSAAAGQRGVVRIDLPAFTVPAAGAVLSLRVSDGEAELLRWRWPLLPVAGEIAASLQAWTAHHAAVAPRVPSPSELAEQLSKPSGLLPTIAKLYRVIPRAGAVVAAARRSGDLAAAEARARRLVEEVPWAPHAHRMLAGMLDERGQRDQAFAALAAAVAAGDSTKDLRDDEQLAALRDDPALRAADRAGRQRHPAADRSSGGTRPRRRRRSVGR